MLCSARYAAKQLGHWLVRRSPYELNLDYVKFAHNEKRLPVAAAFH